MAIADVLHEALSVGVEEVLLACGDNRPTVADEPLRTRIVGAYAGLARAYLEIKAPSRRALRDIGNSGLSLDDYTDLELLEDLAALRREITKQSGPATVN